MLVFVASLSDANRPQRTDQNYLNICKLVESRSFLHSIPQKHDHVSALSEAATKLLKDQIHRFPEAP